MTRPYTIITIVALAIFGIAAVFKKGAIWNTEYVGAARVLLHGGDFYSGIDLDTADKPTSVGTLRSPVARGALPHKLNSFTYPPFSAFFHLPFVPLEAVSPRLARAVWYLILAGSLVYLCKKSWRLSGGPRLEPAARHPAAPAREQIAFLLGQVCVLQFILNALYPHLQTDLVIAALLMAGCAAIAAGRYIQSATWIGIAAAFKLTPLLFAPYLLWRRQWLAAGWLVAVAVGANLLPDLIHPPPRGGLWLTEWYQLYLRPMGKSDYMPGDWKNALNNNQSFAGAANRWLTSGWRANDRTHSHRSAAVRRLFYLLCVAAILPVAWVEWRRRKRRSAARPATGDSPEPGRLPHPLMIECGIVMLLMLLLSPNSSRAHFCIMLLAAFCAARVAVWRRWTFVRVCLGLAIVFSTLSIHIRLGSSKTTEQWLLWLGVVTLSAISLLLACTITLDRQHAAAA